MIKVKGTKESLEAFRDYFEGPPRIAAVTTKDGNGGLTVTVRPRYADRDTEFIKYVAEKFGCTAKIE